jgi:hypothetical protein
MKVLLLILVGLVSFVFGENEESDFLIETFSDEQHMFSPEFCVPKCCPIGEYFNSSSNQCQTEVTREPVESEIGVGHFSVCPGGTWRDVKEKFKFLVEYECAKPVRLHELLMMEYDDFISNRPFESYKNNFFTDGSHSIKNAVFCPKSPLTICIGCYYYSEQVCSLEFYDQSDLPCVQSITNNQTVNVSTKAKKISVSLRQQRTWHVGYGEIFNIYNSWRGDDENISDSWYSDIHKKFNSLREYKCVEYVTDGSKLIQKALLCPKIPVIFCCEFNEYYSINDLRCERWSTGSMGLPPVQSTTNNVTVEVSERDFQVTVDLIQCPNGYHSQLSHCFTLFDDGTVKIDYFTSKSRPGEVCIAKLAPETDFVALFCVPDPCTTSTCLRKCCPRGFLWNSQWGYCKRSDMEFSVDYRNENGQRAPLPRNMPIKPGFTPCDRDKIETISEGDFYILPNGALYVPALPVGHRVFDEYCVDDYYISNQTVSYFTTVKANYFDNLSIGYLGEKGSDLRR